MCNEEIQRHSHSYMLVILLTRITAQELRSFYDRWQVSHNNRIFRESRQFLTFQVQIIVIACTLRLDINELKCFVMIVDSRFRSKNTALMYLYNMYGLNRCFAKVRYYAHDMARRGWHTDYLLHTTSCVYTLQ